MAQNRMNKPPARGREVAPTFLRPNPNPQLVALISYAIDEVSPKLSGHLGERYAPWLEWAREWKDGRRSPGACVDVAHKCFDDEPVGHTLGQLAWGAKEACYDAPQSAWLVIRYVADAMIAFGIAFPKASVLRLMAPFDGPTSGPHTDGSATGSEPEIVYPTPTGKG